MIDDDRVDKWVHLKSNFTILDTDDQIRLLKQLIQAEHIDDKRWPARMLAGLIDGWKNRAMTPDKVPAAEAGVFNLTVAGPGSSLVETPPKQQRAAPFPVARVPVLRLATVVSTDVYLFKLDVQGNEFGVLRGARELFERHTVKTLLMEKEAFLASLKT